MTDAREVIEGAVSAFCGTCAGRPEGPEHTCLRCRIKADDIEEALTAAGFAIVPKEPTTAMVRASTMVVPTWDDDVSRAKWRAMVGAASDE
jgi:aspartate aminotransferase-like enzyme